MITAMDILLLQNNLDLSQLHWFKNNFQIEFLKLRRGQPLYFNQNSSEQHNIFYR